MNLQAPKGKVIGEKYNRLTIIEDLGLLPKHGRMQQHVKALCDCGNECVGLYSNIKKGALRSCGCYRRERIINAQKGKVSPKFIDITGQRFGRYTVIGKIDNRNNDTIWLCKCDCGSERNVYGSALRRGASKSCGCLKKETCGDRTRTHGLSKHPLHAIWRRILERCGNPNDKSYNRYGGRGIYVADDWATDFQAFYDWCMGNGWAKGLQIDREKNDGPYSPSNCRIVTRKVNCRNRRNNRWITCRGMTKTLAEFAEMVGERTDVISYRMRHGWTEEEAIFTPFKRKK
jgi:hypothetical protein